MICDKLISMTKAQFLKFYSNEYKEDENDDDLITQYYKIINYCKNMKKNNYKIEMNYKQTKTTPEGRLFSEGASLQNIWKSFRSVLCEGMYIDLDMKNAHPTILLKICKLNKIEDTKHLLQYINERDSIFTMLSSELGTNKEEIKKLFLKSINSCYSIEKFNKKKIKNNFFINFDKEMKQIQKYIYSIYFNIIGKDLQDEENKEGKLLNRLLCTHENLLLNRIIDYNNNNKINTGVLMFDGLMIYNDNYDNIFINNYINKLNELTNDYNIKWTVKDFDTSIKETIMKFEDKIIFSDTIEAANYMLQNILKNKLIICNGEIWYNDNNLWSVFEDKEIERFLYKIISEQNYLLEVENTKGEINYKKFTKIDKYIREIRTAIISQIETDNNLIHTIHNDTLKKVCFKNGYYDFEKKQFIKNYDFKTAVIINRDFEESNNEQIRKDIYNNILYPIFGDDSDELIDYYLYRLARSIGGYIVDKKFFIMMGMRNSGKGCLTELLLNCFQDYVKSMDAKHFIYKTNNTDDPAKMLGFLINHMYARISITHEIKIGEKIYLDGNMIKQFTSGGDRIRARKNYYDEIEFNTQATLWMNCNDLPECKPTDAMKYVDIFELKTVFYDENENIEDKINGIKYVLKNDYIKTDFIKNEHVINEFINMIFEAFYKPVVIPEQLIKDNEEFKEDDDYNKLINLFEYTNNEKDIIYNKELQDILKDNNIEFTIKKASKLLQKYNCMKVTKNNQRGLSKLKLKNNNDDIMDDL